MLAIAAVYLERWNTAAMCVATATCFKVYPIAVGLLICVIAPRRFMADADCSFSPPHRSFPLPALALCFEPISCLDCDSDVGRSTSMAHRKASVGSLVFAALGRTSTDPSQGLYANSVRYRRRASFILRCSDLEGMGEGSRFSRSVLSGLDLDDSLWAGHGIVHLRPPRRPSSWRSFKRLTRLSLLTSVLGLPPRLFFSYWR